MDINNNAIRLGIAIYTEGATHLLMPQAAEPDVMQDWDFTSLSELPSDFTNYRLGNTATRFNSSGLIEVMAQDTARIDHYYDATNGQWLQRGWLVEIASTNLLSYSTVSTAHTGFSLASSSSFSDSTTYKKLTGESATIINAGNQTYHGAYADGTNRPSLNTSFKHTLSCYTHKLLLQTNSSMQLRIGSSGIGGTTGLLDFASSTAPVAPDVEKYSFIDCGNYIRYSCTRQPNSSASTVVLYSGTSGSTRQYIVDGIQIEMSEYATSYIPATGTATTRNADVTQYKTSTEKNTWLVELESQADNTITRQFVDLDGTAWSHQSIGLVSGWIRRLRRYPGLLTDADKTTELAQADTDWGVKPNAL